MFVISIWYECDFPLILYWYECDYIFIFIWYECDYLFFLCIGKPLTWSRGVNHGGGAERGKLLQGNRLKRQYCEELQLFPSTTKHRVFRRFSLRIDFFLFWMTGMAGCNTRTRWCVEVLLFDRKVKYAAAASRGTFGFAQWSLKCSSQRISENLQNSTKEW